MRRVLEEVTGPSWDALYHVLWVRETPNILERLLGAKPRLALYERLRSGLHFWAMSNHLVTYGPETKLGRWLRAEFESWEHRQPGPPPAQLQQVYECDCGRRHPEGWICGVTIGGRL